MRAQIVRAVRGLVTLIVTVSLISVLMEERVGKGKCMSLGHSNKVAWFMVSEIRTFNHRAGC